jgi:CheY-like chemotaxis protein
LIFQHTILLVEDDPADSRLIQRAFLKADVPANVIRLTNGDDAISYLRGEAPHDNRALFPLPYVVLLDIKLPRRSGFEVLRWMKERGDNLRRIPVVMMTSSRHAVDVNRAYDLGANSYLTKPETTEQREELALVFKSYWLTLNEPPTVAGAQHA